MEDMEFEEDIILFPLIDTDSDNSNQDVKDRDENENENENEREEEDDGNNVPFKPLMSLRQRRHSRLTGINLVKLNLNLVNNANDRQEPKIREPRILCHNMSPRVRGNWMRALRKVRSMTDPWAKLHIDDLPVESATRHRYSALKKKWVEDTVQVKMEKEPFNHGAMRSCFRLKKLSSFSHKQDWKYAMNYVCKQYMEKVDRDVYFEDVRLQMDAKLWGEEYNRHNPPKKVDIFQMYILEFKNRPGSPLYHLEHFIEGKYIKYNSNSGFVEESLRLTPQAFSHFTFERSGHKLIVVDIQGVGDLWTDPQVHTSDGKGYGDGNLGTRGMALFFHSHICNSICKTLGLATFDLAQAEAKDQEKFIQQHKNAMTIVRGSVEQCVSASPTDCADLTSFLARSRSRTTSSCSSSMSQTDWGPLSPVYDEDSPPASMETDDEPMSPDFIPSPRARNPRIRFLSDSEDSSSTLTMEEERIKFQQAVSRAHRPSCIAHEINMRNMLNRKVMGDSILGQIHHDLAKYHELGRFASDNNDRDMEAALFHEQQAAELGILEAILTLAYLYMGMQRDVLVDYNVENNETNLDKGVDYMMKAAEAGDRSAMIYMAEAYRTGNGLGFRKQSWEEALHWYQEAVNTTEDHEADYYDATMDNPTYQLQAKMAEMYLEGGYELEKDPSSAGDLYNEAAEGAMAAMKGRLANKYYALAEEAYGQVEE